MSEPTSVAIDRAARVSLGVALGLLIMRVYAGTFIAAFHGWDKLSNFSEKVDAFADPLGVGATTSLALAIFAEFFCGIGLILGLMTRLATIPLITTMLVAAFIVHGADPWPKKEFALVYLIPFVTLLFTGPGPFSLDALIWPKVFKKAV